MDGNEIAKDDEKGLSTFHFCLWVVHVRSLSGRYPDESADPPSHQDLGMKVIYLMNDFEAQGKELLGMSMSTVFPLDSFEV